MRPGRRDSSHRVSTGRPTLGLAVLGFSSEPPHVNDESCSNTNGRTY